MKITPEEKIIEKVYPRCNRLFRPPVANVDQAVALMSVSKPSLDLVLLDRLLVTAGKAQLGITICLNKVDLLTAPETDRVEAISRVFRDCGYRVVLTSALTGLGVSELIYSLQNKVNVFAGPSGAGKSTFINKLKPGLALPSGPVSPRTERGRHTTRHIELIKLDGNTFVVDTPGFQKLDLDGIAPQKLSFYFREMASLPEPCRFSSCLHRAEPGCAVKEALQRGKIAAWRYNHYLDFLAEIEEQEKRKY